MRKQSLLCASTASIAAIAILATPVALAASTAQAYKVLGMGVAVEQPGGDPHRSRIGFLAIVNSTDEGSSQLSIRRGLIVINDEGSPVRYQMVPDTWHGIVHNNGKGFDAEGKVSDADGNLYNVKLKADEIRETSRGTLIQIEAGFSGQGEHYDITYLALLSRVVRERPAQESQG